MVRELAVLVDLVWVGNNLTKQKTPAHFMGFFGCSISATGAEEIASSWTLGGSSC